MLVEWRGEMTQTPVLSLRWGDKSSKFRKIHQKSIFQYIIGPRKKCVPLDILSMCRFYFGLPGNDCTKDEKTAEEVGRLRRPTSCSLKYSHFLEVQYEIYTC